ncbi:MAG: ACP S-malonyltransferase [Desulfovibrionaceae bacterium]
MPHTALLFPGQGSQEAGMGRSFAEASADAMQLWKKAEHHSGLPLRAIYWEGNEADMADTRALQPALTVVNLSIWFALAPTCTPVSVAGHSLGEYSALAAAKVLPVDSVLELTAVRGKLMAEADPHGTGGMAAIVKLDQNTVEDIVRQSMEATGEILRIANYNTPAQLVISGTKAAVEHACALTKEHKGRAIALKVSGAFHSPLMAEAAQELRSVLRKAPWHKASFPVYCNVCGTAVNQAEHLRERMLEQMTASVQWINTMGHMWQDGARAFMEIGPKAVLSKMVQPCLSAFNITPPENTPIVHIGSLEDTQTVHLP